MADYAKMYKELFRAVTRAIDILQKAQQDAEEIYISADESITEILPLKGGSEKNDDDQS